MVRSRDSLAANDLAHLSSPGSSLQGVVGGFLRHRPALYSGKLFLLLSRTLAFGGGTALPGRLAEAIDPSIQRWLTRSLADGCILITGTNGKTTTCSMLRRILEGAGRKATANPSGSNLSRGITSALIERANMGGRVSGDVGVFEVDEAALRGVASSLPVRSIAILNLFRDQLDRYGELDLLAASIGAGLQGCPTIYLNADDPLVASLSRFVSPGAKVKYFGIDGPRPSLSGSETPDSNRCPFCGCDLVYRHVSYSHVGDYSCPSGDFGRPLLDLRLTMTEDRGVEGLSVLLEGDEERVAVDLPLPGIHNAYNALAALAVADGMGVSLAKAAQSLSGMSPAFGRGEVVQCQGRDLHLLLVKNPTSFNQTIHTVLVRDREAPCLMLVNDNLADGKDVSWLWDVCFEDLADRSIPIVAGGLRRFDLALRLNYAAVESRVEEDYAQGLQDVLEATPVGGRAYVVASYTAMLEMRKVIGRKVKIKEFWA